MLDWFALWQVAWILDFLVEAVQGPCSENQVLLAQGEMIDACKLIIGSSFSARRLKQHEIKVLKSKAMKALVSLLEGRSRGDRSVHDMLADKMETSLLRVRLVAIYKVSAGHTSPTSALSRVWVSRNHFTCRLDLQYFADLLITFFPSLLLSLIQRDL